MKVENEVLRVLDRARADGNALFLVGQLDRRVYERTNKVLEAAGGKWNRKAKAHLFTGEAAERVEQILLTGSIDIPKDEFEFFPTPSGVAARVVELAEISVGHHILEPSAGRGALIAPLEPLGVSVHCIEKMPANAEHLRTLGWLDSVTEGDFLTVEPLPVYDRVMMNPPFGKQADIKHVMHALRFLKPDGLLASVMSASVTFRDNRLTADFRNLIRERGDIEALPEGSFKASGTGVNTVIVTIHGEAA